MANRWYTQFFGTLHKKPVMMDCNFVVDPTNGNGFGVRSLKGGGIASVFMHTTASFTGNTHSNTVIDGIATGTGNLRVGDAISGSGVAVGTKIASITSGTAITITIATSSTLVATVISYTGITLNGQLNPNPAAGYIVVNFQDNFNYYFFGTAGFVSPISGTPISISGAGVLTIGQPYVIVSVGTSTQANWNSVGLPSGIIPFAGEAFVASVTGGGIGTGVVEAVTSSGIMQVEVVGDPNQTIGANYNGASILGGGGSGAYMILQCLNTSGVPTAPAANTVIGLSFFMSNSFIQIQGD